ncbi:hypothetical protein CsSME_00004189 [Camellia sinensis var. sinensis]
MVSVLILSWKLWRKLDGGDGGLDEGYWNAKLQRLAPTASMGSSFTPDKIVNAASHLSVLGETEREREGEGTDENWVEENSNSIYIYI